MAAEIRAILRLKDEFSKSFKKVTKSTGRDIKALSKVFVGLSAAAGAVFLKLADDMIVFENRIKAVTDSVEEAATAIDGIVQISRDTRSAIATTSVAFQRFSIATKELGLDQTDVLELVEQVSLAIKLSGTTAKEASAGMIQFAQGLGAGALRGDELRSVMEQMPVVARIIAKEFGITTAKLKVLGEKGLLTSKRLVAAFKNAGPDLKTAFEELTPTIGDTLTVLFGELKLFVREFDKIFGVSGLVVEAINSLSSVLRAATEALKAIRPVLSGDSDASITPESIKAVITAFLSRAFPAAPAAPGTSPSEQAGFTRAPSGRITDLDAIGRRRFGTHGPGAGGQLGFIAPTITPFPSAERRRAAVPFDGGARRLVGRTFGRDSSGSGNLTIPKFDETRIAAEDAIPDLTPWQEGLKQIKDGYSDVNLALQGVAGTAQIFLDRTSDAFASIIDGSKSAKEAFADMAAGMLQDLSRLIIKLLIAKAIQVALGGLFPGAAAAGPSSQGLGPGGVQGIGAAHGGFVRPGQIVQATLHGGRFGEEIHPLTSRGDRGGGGGTTIINNYNITAIDVEDFDRKMLASTERQSAEVSAVVAATSRNSRGLRSAFQIN